MSIVRQSNKTKDLCILLNFYGLSTKETLVPSLM